MKYEERQDGCLGNMKNWEQNVVSSLSLSLPPLHLQFSPHYLLNTKENTGTGRTQSFCFTASTTRKKISNLEQTCSNLVKIIVTRKYGSCQKITNFKVTTYTGVKIQRGSLKKEKEKSEQKMLLLSHFSRVRLCATSQMAAHHAYIYDIHIVRTNY